MATRNRWADLAEEVDDIEGEPDNDDEKVISRTSSNETREEVLEQFHGIIHELKGCQSERTIIGVRSLQQQFIAILYGGNRIDKAQSARHRSC